MHIDYDALRRGYPIMAGDILNDEEITWLLGSERCACGHLGAFHAEEFCWVPDCDCPIFRTPPQVLAWEAKAIAQATKNADENAEWNAVWAQPTEEDVACGPTYRYLKGKAFQT
jgi:hypothetical protein